MRGVGRWANVACGVLGVGEGALVRVADDVSAPDFGIASTPSTQYPTPTPPFRLGVFGGSFDPVHIGHLRMAEVAREAARLDTVLLVPAQVSPFKTDRTVVPAALRLEMLREAVGDNPNFAVSDWEVSQAGPSYTVNTLRHLRDQYPQAELFFLTGTDAVRDLPRWREPEAILEMAHFLVMTRPGTGAQDVLDALPDAWEARIDFITMPGLDISSSYLRQQAAAGRSMRYLVPPSVERFIREHRLYRGAGDEEASIRGETIGTKN